MKPIWKIQYWHAIFMRNKFFTFLEFLNLPVFAVSEVLNFDFEKFQPSKIVKFHQILKIKSLENSQNTKCEIQDISTSISIEFKVEQPSEEDDESDKHLEALGEMLYNQYNE